MIVATATDRNFVEMTGVMLRSLMANGGLSRDRVIVFGDRLKPADEKNLKASGGDRVEVLPIGSARQAVSRLRTTLAWPTATYFRLLAPNELQGDRLLYLDCDVLINGSLAELETVALNGHILGAVHEHPRGAIKCNSRLGRPDATPYFNAGVQLIDIARWHAGDLTRKTIAWLEAHPRAWAQDQDALNSIVGDDWQPLDPTYNSHCYGPEAPAEVIRASRIIHFTGRRKPHEAACNHHGKALFVAQREHTPWGGRPLLSERRRKVRRMLQRLGRIFTAPRPT